MESSNSNLLNSTLLVLRRSAAAFVKVSAAGYSVHFSANVISRALQIIRSEGFRHLLSLENLLSESKLNTRVQSIRFALFLGSLSGLHRLLIEFIPLIRKHLIRKHLPNQQPSGSTEEEKRTDSFIAGFIAGLSIFFLDPDFRLWITMYSWPRLAQTIVRDLSLKGAFNGFGVFQYVLKHADTALFCLTTSQVMWAYVMAPWTLPRSYWNFIVRVGPNDPTVLRLLRRTATGREQNLGEVIEYYKRVGGVSNHGPFPTDISKLIPHEVIHPFARTCTQAAAVTFKNAFQAVLPMYSSIFVISSLFKMKSFIKDPLSNIIRVLVSSLRSSTFLATFNAVCFILLCQTRNFFSRENDLCFYPMCSIAALAVLIEPKNRRAELGLYVLPRAVDSLRLVGQKYGWLPRGPKYSKEVIFCFILGMMLRYYHNHPFAVPPFISWIMEKLFGRPLLPRKLQPSVVKLEELSDAEAEDSEMHHNSSR